MADNSDFESVDVCTWTFLMIWMPVLRFSLAFLRWFADFNFIVSSGNFMIIMVGNQHGSTISRKDSLLLCNYPIWVCKAFFGLVLTWTLIGSSTVSKTVSVLPKLFVVSPSLILKIKNGQFLLLVLNETTADFIDKDYFFSLSAY